MQQENLLTLNEIPVRQNSVKFQTRKVILPLVLLFAVLAGGCNKGENASPSVSGAKTTSAINDAVSPVGPGPIDLKTSGSFVILTETGITTTGTTAITGDIATSPIAATAMTGFGFVMDASGQFSTSSLITGKAYAANYATPTPAKMTAAIGDMQTAFTTANGLVINPIINPYAGDISGQTLKPGLYKWSTGVLITSVGVTLTGGVNDTWVFQIAQNLTVDNSAIITLAGGAQAKNIFWVVSGKTTLGTYSNFSGIILDKTLISLNTGAKVDGRLLAQTAVTLIANTVTQP